mmetsp:Transcript_25201/g.99442  ORF Transcript_25201/g.99442 Transcript_25201/m.99442 type:complete len:231 (-) Transcript_25201:771-1463(-)
MICTQQEIPCYDGKHYKPSYPHSQQNFKKVAAWRPSSDLHRGFNTLQYGKPCKNEGGFRTFELSALTKHGSKTARKTENNLQSIVSWRIHQAACENQNCARGTCNAQPADSLVDDVQRRPRSEKHLLKWLREANHSAKHGCYKSKAEEKGNVTSGDRSKQRDDCYRHGLHGPQLFPVIMERTAVATCFPVPIMGGEITLFQDTFARVSRTLIADFASPSTALEFQLVRIE